jgi:acyl-CoA thioesterase FadM
MLLDEVMAKACLQREFVAVTVQFEVRFRKPVYVSEEVAFRGRVLEVRGRRIKAEARCLGEGGEERAAATALFLRQ